MGPHMCKTSDKNIKHGNRLGESTVAVSGLWFTCLSFIPLANIYGIGVSGTVLSFEDMLVNKTDIAYPQ